MNVCFSSLDVDHLIFFHGTDDEIEAAEKKENARAEELSRLIEGDDFVAFEYVDDNGSRQILHPSTREGVKWQLSYIASDGIPSMHENYGRTDEKEHDYAIHPVRELLRHFVNMNLRHPLNLTVMTV